MEMGMDTIEKQMNSLPSKAAKIRFLADAGWERAEIAKKLGIRYQHVRNVLVRDQKADAPAFKSPLLAKLAKIAEAEGQPFQVLVDEALRDFIEKKRNAKARPHVLSTFEQIAKKRDWLYKQLAK